MNLHSTLLVAFAGVALTATAARAQAYEPSIRHVPPAEATPDAPLELTADVARAWESTLTLHYRTIGGGAWTELAFERAGGDAADTAWNAVVPADAIAPPGVEYYIDSRGAAGADAAPAGEFASAARPHQVIVMRTKMEERRDRELARAGNRRYRIIATGEWVDYGARDIGGLGTIDDRYYRTDIGFSYRLLSFPIERIHIGYTRMLGDVPDTERSSTDGCGQTPGSVNCRLHVGYKVGGWFGVRLGVGQGIDLDVRGMVMATNEGAGGGASAELHVGDEDGSHVALGFEAISAIGAAGRFRLGWATVPGLPMAATVEVTNLPSTVRATGIRVLYDIAHPIAPGVRLGGRIGYAARDAQVGGVSAGANLTLDF